MLVDSTPNKIVVSSSLIEIVSLPPEVLRVSQNNKRERFELNSTENVVVSSLLLPAKENTVISFSSNTERTTAVTLIPTSELISLPIEVSGDSHSRSYRGVHALTTIFDVKRVLGPLDHPAVLSEKSKSKFLPSEGPEHSLNALERISSGDIPHQLPSQVALMDTLTVDTPVPTYTVSINKMKIVIKRGSEIHSQKCCHLV